ncbi:MAG: orotidine-5'-phosphate decarboxylase [Armatimonadota bacterium]
MNSTERILVALDVDTADSAVAMVRELAGAVGGWKVGLELVNAAGFEIFDRLRDAGADRIFYDAKFHDIPNTVAGAVRAAAKRGVWMVNVHACGGAAMLAAARDAANEADTPPLLIGVTVLTSISEIAFRDELRGMGTVAEQVLHFARLARSTGLDGVVCSPLEVSDIQTVCGSQFVTVVPGVRPAGAATHDQARFATPGDAVRNGAKYLVVGRAITGAVDRIAAARTIAAEIDAATEAA